MTNFENKNFFDIKKTAAYATMFVLLAFIAFGNIFAFQNADLPVMTKSGIPSIMENMTQNKVNVINEMPSATITADIPFGGLDLQKGDFKIIRTMDEMDAFIKSMSNEFLKKDYIRAQYAKYGEEFFRSNILVLAVVDKGSGVVKYNVASTELQCDAFVVKINRNAPLIQTMDYRTFIMIMELDKVRYSDIKNVQIILNDVGAFTPDF